MSSTETPIVADEPRPSDRRASIDLATGCEPTTDRLQCMEVVGGNGATHRKIETTGLDVTIFSRPHESDPYGGDVHYLTGCASGRITRIVVADVAGHGASVAERARQLRDIARDNVNHIRHQRMVKRTNREFSDDDRGTGFATGVFVTLFQPTGGLRLCNAGHPPPFLFTAETGEWSSFSDPERRNLPLGVVPDTTFHELTRRMELGDAVLIVTDGLLESRDGDGSMLGSDGLEKWLGEFGTPSDDLVARIAARVLERTDGEPGDDLTLLLLRKNDNRVGTRDQLLAPVRYLTDLVGLRSSK